MNISRSQKISPSRKSEGAGQEDTYLLLDSEKTASIVKAVAVQQTKMESMEKSIAYLVKAVDNLTAVVSNTMAKNRNNNSNVESPKRHFSDKKKRCFVESKIDKKKKQRFDKSRSSKSEVRQLVYVNELFEQEASATSNNTKPNETELAIIDLDSSDNNETSDMTR